MREILCRGKRVDNGGEWVVGFYWNRGNLAHYIKVIDEDGNILGDYEVLPATVGEYTGKTDKFGERVFDGDILERKYNGGKYVERCVVRSVLTETGYCFNFDGFSYDLDIDMDRCRIIGNIYENPELLEEIL